MSSPKHFVIDSSILQLSPYAIFAFDDNFVYLCQDVIEEMRDLSKTGSNEVRGNARQLGIILDDLLNAISDGTAKKTDVGMYQINMEGGQKIIFVPNEYFSGIPYNDGPQVIRLMRALPESNTSVCEPILVSRDPYLRAKVKGMGLKAEEFRSDSLPVGSSGYDGRCVMYLSSGEFTEFARTGYLHVEKEGKGHYFTKVSGISMADGYSLSTNEYVMLVDSSNPQNTLLGRYDGNAIVSLYGYGAKCSKPVYGVTPRNVGQRFALDALLTPAEEAPLVILKGPAGTAKTFLSMASALAQTVDQWEGENRYRKILLTRPNTKMDDDIGYLKGDEVQKVMPALRGLTDNVDNLMPGHDKGVGKSKAEISALDSLMSQGVIDAQAMAYMRGRSITRQFIIVDEAQNATVTQILSLITRVGEGSKIVILGDPDQIDHPFLDRRNNGLVYASERMMGSPLCWQVTFDETECTRSALAGEAIARLTQKGVIL